MSFRIEMVTDLSGSALSLTFTVTEPPSSTVYDPCSKLTLTLGSSSSVSWVALKTKVFSISPLLNVTLAGIK